MSPQILHLHAIQYNLENIFKKYEEIVNGCVLGAAMGAFVPAHCATPSTTLFHAYSALVIFQLKNFIFRYKY